MNRFALLLMLLCITAHAAPPDERKWTDPRVAEKLGITVQQLHSLRDHFGISNESLLSISRQNLQPLLFEVEHPGFDKHREEQRFRALRLLDEHGAIPPKGLLNALEHRKHLEV